jgi:hypothetical protein
MSILCKFLFEFKILVCQLLMLGSFGTLLEFIVFLIQFLIQEFLVYVRKVQSSQLGY